MASSDNDFARLCERLARTPPAGPEPTVGPDELALLRLGLTRAFLDTEQFHRLFGVLWDIQDAGVTREEALPSALKEAVLEGGLASLLPPDLVRLATSLGWLAEVNNAIDTRPSPHWRSQLHAAFPEEDPSDPVTSPPGDRVTRATPFIDETPFEPRPRPPGPMSEQDELRIGGVFEQPGETAAAGPSPIRLPARLAVPAANVNCLSGSAPATLVVEFSLAEEDGGRILEVQLDPLRLTRDVVCTGRLITADGVELARAVARDRRLRLPIPTGGPGPGTVFECDYRRGEAHVRFRVALGGA